MPWDRASAAAVALVVALVVALGVGVSAGATLRGDPARHARDAVTAADYLRDRARPGDSAHVMYAYASVLYYSGMSAPFAYRWSLMMQAAPGAERELRRLLASPRRPTWLIERHRPWAFGLDRDGVTRRLIDTHYRPAATVCGMTILVARRAGDRAAADDEHDCAVGAEAKRGARAVRSAAPARREG